jgi:hypothetical protein
MKNLTAFERATGRRCSVIVTNIPPSAGSAACEVRAGGGAGRSIRKPRVQSRVSGSQAVSAPKVLTPYKQRRMIIIPYLDANNNKA